MVTITLALSNSTDMALAWLTLVAIAVVLVSLLIFTGRRLAQSRHSPLKGVLAKIKGRHIWAAVLAIGASSTSIGYFKQEATLAAITDSLIAFAIASIFYWAGLAIYRAITRD